MKQHFSVFASDAAGRDGMTFLPEAMLSSLVETWESGVPTLLGHDAHRPLGWSRMCGLFFEPGLTRLYGNTSIAETAQEAESLGVLMRSAQLQRCALLDDAAAGELRRVIGRHLDGDEELVECNGTALLRNQLARDVWPELFGTADKDGLCSLSGLEYLGQGVFEQSGLLIYAHPYFRRSLSRLNAPNDTLLRLLKSSACHGEVRVALDPDMVGLASTFTEYIEREYWRGPLFRDDITAIPAGVTVYVASEEDRHVRGIQRTECHWYSRDRLHVLEIEELRDIPTFGSSVDIYGCRYLHSIADETTGEIVHVDGAVKEYDEESMIGRLDADMLSSAKSPRYTKLWRVDGAISVHIWKSIISEHFRDNDMVGQYLRGQGPAAGGNTDTAEVADPESQEDGPWKELLPRLPARGTGPRVTVTARPTMTGVTEPVVVPLEAWHGGDTVRALVELGFIEVMKSLRKRGKPSVRASGVTYYQVEDDNTNWPLVFHSRASDMEATIDALIGVLNAWSARGQKGAVSVAVAFNRVNCAIQLAILGCTSDVVAALAKLRELCHAMDSDNYGWATQLAEYLANRYPPVQDRPPLTELWSRNGGLLIRRVPVDRELFDVKARLSDSGSIEYRVRIPTEEQDVQEALRKGKIVDALGIWLYPTCSRCQRPYEECPCSVLSDDQVQFSGKVIPFEVYWAGGNGTGDRTKKPVTPADPQ